MPPPKKAKTSAEDVPADGGVAQPASASLQRPFSPGGLLSETARRELELQRREEELAQRERELRRREGLLSVQQEQADAVVKVKRERLASSATQAAKLESDLHARAAELAGLKSAAVEQGAQLQAMASKMKEAEQELECSICMERSAATALNPCGHCFCCSEDCASASAAVCPMCSRAIESRTRIFGAKVEPTEGISGEHLGAIAADLARAAAAVGGGGQNGADIGADAGLGGGNAGPNVRRDGDGRGGEMVEAAFGALPFGESSEHVHIKVGSQVRDARTPLPARRACPAGARVRAPRDARSLCRCMKTPAYTCRMAASFTSRSRRRCS